MIYMCRVRIESSRVYDVLEDIMGHIFIHLHNIQDNLQFWQPLIEVLILHPVCLLLTVVSGKFSLL